MNDFIQLEERILSYCQGYQVYYLANPGNWGDAVIRYATKRFFHDIGLKHTELYLIEKRSWISPLFKKSVLIYGGGGGWCRNWNHASQILRRKLFLFNKVLVLPSTYEESYKLPKTLFFRRDNFESKSNMPDALFCHDMAFYLELKPTLPKNGKTGNFFREDRESNNTMDPVLPNVDITKDKNHYDPIFPLIELLSQYSTINTDKLHIAILSAKIGIRVNFYPGNYFKNKAVFLSSLQEYYPKVQYIDQ